MDESNGDLDEVQYIEDPIFGVQVPTHCPNVPNEVLSPKNSWADQAAFEVQAKKLAQMFVDNFKEFEGSVSAEIKAAAPKAD